jgi:tetratricopeptide (TPR) repeat protein
MLLDFEGAKSTATGLVDIFPRSHLYRSNLALYGMYAGDYVMAAREAREAIALNPLSGGQYLPLAVGAAYAGNLPEARRWYDAMAKGDGQAQRLEATCRADLLIYTGDLDAAREVLTSSLAADITARSTASAARKHLMLAELALVQQDRGAATAAARKAAETVQTPQVLFRSAITLVDAGESGLAVALMNKFPSRVQGVDLWFRRIVDTELAIQHNDAEATVRFESQLERERGPWFAHFYAGRLRVRSGNVAAALPHFAWCLQHRPEAAAAYMDDVATIRYWADAWYWSGVANEQGGDMTIAKDSYRRFLAPRGDARDVRSTDVRRRLASLTASTPITSRRGQERQCSAEPGSPRSPFGPRPPCG